MANKAVRHSHQRDLILNTVKSSRMHPSAEWIYNTLKKDHPRLSLGTVYRNLDQLARSGQISKVGTQTASVRFDGQTHPHYHVLCTCCGALEDLDIPYQTQLDEMVREKLPSVTGHMLYFEGLCQSCAAKEKETAADAPGESGK